MSIAIFNRKMGMKLEILVEGSIVADGSEQIVVEESKLSILSGFIDLGSMEAGDNLTIRQYIKLIGNWRLYADESYAGVQIQPALYITNKTANNIVRITLEQTMGTYRNFPYEFSREI